MSSLVSVRNLASSFVSAFLAFSLVACAAAAPADDAADEASDSSESALSATAHFETFVGEDGQHYFSLVAANGQNVLRSEGYAQKASATAAIRSLVENGVDAAAYEQRTANNGEYYFVIKADNGEVIAVAETYSTASNALRAARTVRTLVSRTGQPTRTSPAPKARRFETFVGEDGKDYFHLRAANGEIVLQSQAYASKQGATRGIEVVKNYGIYASNYEIVETVSGEWSVRLLAGNGAIVAKGESYSTKSNATRAVARIAEIVVGGPILQ